MCAFRRLRDPIALLHDMSYYTPKAAQAMLEWCNERISKNFDVGRQNPFQFSYVCFLRSARYSSTNVTELCAATST